MTVYGHGSADPRTLEKYDHLPPEMAIIRAWTDGDPSPRWHALAVRDVHNAMPLLARAVERLVQREQERQENWREDEKKRREVADFLKDDLFDYSNTEVHEDVPVTDPESGEIVGQATVVTGPDHTFRVRATLTDQRTINMIRGSEVIGHIPAIDAFLNDPEGLGIKRSRPIKPAETDQPEPSDPPASPQP